MTALVKICGLSSAATLDAALEAGADMVGFVRFQGSPRHVDLRVGRELSRLARGRAERVILLVDPTDAELAEAVDAIDSDLIQLHGHETTARVAAIRTRTGRSVMKALGIADAADLDQLPAYLATADRILLDAKAPRGAIPGGNGVAFDWSLLAALDPTGPIMLSGGLDTENVGRAIAATGLWAIDVSSGVENAPGVKDPAKIASFVKAARAAFAAEQTRRGA